MGTVVQPIAKLIVRAFVAVCFGLALTTAGAAQTTLTFSGPTANLGTTVTDGEAGSADVPDLDFEITSSPALPLFYASPAENPFPDAIVTGAGNNVTNWIMSANGKRFTLDGFVMTYQGFGGGQMQTVLIQGFLNGSLRGSTTVNIFDGQRLALARGSQLPSSAFDTVDEVRLSSVNFPGFLQVGLQDITVSSAETPPPTVTLTVSPDTVTEGSGVMVGATATLSAPAATDTTVAVALSGTAQASEDYVPFGTIIVPAGTISRTRSFGILDDTSDEPDETIVIDIASISGGDGATENGIQQAIITILDNDAPPSVTVVEGSGIEGDAGTPTVPVTFRLSSVASQPLSFEVQTESLTATQGVDFVATAQTVNFAAGEIEKTISIPIIPDSETEGNETIGVVFSNPQNVTVPTGTVPAATIIDDDVAVTITLSDATPDESSGSVVLTATLSSTRPIPTTISLSYLGTARTPADFTAPTSIEIPANTLSQSISITLVDDLADERDETIEITVTPSRVRLAGPSIYTITIIDNDEMPTLSVSVDPTSVVEGDSGTATVNATFTLSANSERGAAFNVFQQITGAPGTADGQDVAFTSESLVFTRSVTSITRPITIVSDTTVETDEVATFEIRDIQNVSVPNPTFSFTILNDDSATVSLSADSNQLDEDGGPVTLTVNLSERVPNDTIVNLAYSGTASRGSDFSGPASITIPANVLSSTGTLDAAPDGIDEPTETVIVAIAGITGGAVSNGTQEVAIELLDSAQDGPQVSLSGDISVAEGNTGSESLTFTVTLSAASQQPVSVDYFTQDETAVAGSDYQPTNGTLTFSPGETTRTFTVAVNGDTLVERTEEFNVIIDNVVNGARGSSTLARVILTNDDSATLSISGVSLNEGNSGSTSFGFDISLSQPVDADVTFNFKTADGSAIAGTDYTTTGPIAVTIPSGGLSATVPVPVIGDNLLEPDETFTATVDSIVSSDRPVTVATGQAFGTILNDDAIPSVLLSAVPLTISETSGNSTVTATLSNASSQDVTVALAYSGNDVTGPNSIVIPSGQLSASVTVAAIANEIDEADRTVTIDIVSVTNGREDGEERVTLTITDDDDTPLLSIGDAAISEGDTGSQNLVFTVRLSAASNLPVSVGFATADAGATVADGDYVAQTGTVTFKPGEIEQSIAIVISGDTVAEADETFTLVLSSPVNANLGDAEAIGTILNDDAVPSVQLSAVPLTISEASGSSTVTATLSNASSQDVTVALAYSGNDVTGPDGIVIPTGEISASATVTAVDNAIDEADRTVTIDIVSVTNGREDGEQRVTLTITDDDETPSLTISDAAISEGDTGSRDLVFTVRLSAASNLPVSVGFATVDAGATVADGDYVAQTGTVTFKPGEIEQSIAIVISGDTVAEADETFTLVLSSPVNANLGDAEAIGTILNDDAVPGLTVSGVSVDEDVGVAKIIASIDAAAGIPISFSWSTADGSAEASTDYVAVTNGAATIPVGDTSVALEITIVDDDNEEDAETLQVRLTNATGASIAEDAATVTINRSDVTAPFPVLSSPDGPFAGPFTLAVTFDEPVTGLALEDFELDNAEANNLQGSGAAYSLTIVPQSDGELQVRLPAGAATDALGTPSQAAVPLVGRSDVTSPTVTISSSDGPTVTGSFEIQIAFSEEILGLELSDLAITNGSATDLSTTDNVTFTARVTPQAPGEIVISLAAGAATDATGNPNEPSSTTIEAVLQLAPISLQIDAATSDPSTVTAIASFTNPGSTALAFSLESDVAWITIEPESGTVSPLSQQSVVVRLNNTVNELEPGSYAAVLTFTTASGSLEIPVTLTVAARFGQITLIASTPSGPSGDAQFSYASDIGAFDGLNLATNGGQASATAGELLGGSYTISQSTPPGWRLDSIDCVGDLDSGSTFDVENGRATIDLDPNETLTCTFSNKRDEQAVRLATQRAIRNFMVRRADRIVSGTPDIARRFADRVGTRGGGFGGNLDGEGRYRMQIASSLSGLRAKGGAETELASGISSEQTSITGIDVWVAAELTGVSDNRDGEGVSSDFAIAQLGIDFQINDAILLGVLGQYDWMSEKSLDLFEEAGAVRGARVEGEGWMVGPYAAWRIRDSFIFDALAMYGRSNNTVDPLGLYRDRFETERMMVRANLTGEFAAGRWRLRPRAGITHFEETQGAYVDSLNIDIPSQTISLGRLQVGPEVAWRLENRRGSWLEVLASVDGVWDYDTAELLNSAGLLVGGDENFRADARIGIAAGLPSGATIRFEGGFDGIGVGNFSANGARIQLVIPLGPHGQRGSTGRAPVANALGGAGGQCGTFAVSPGFGPGLGPSGSCDIAPAMPHGR